MTPGHAANRLVPAHHLWPSRDASRNAILAIVTPTSRLKLLTTGQDFRVEFSRPLDAVDSALRQSTMSRLDDLVDSYLPTHAPPPLLTGVIANSSYRLCTPVRLRAPWWPLTPILRAQLTAAEDRGCVMQGNLVVRRTTLAAVAVLIGLGYLLGGPLLAAAPAALFAVHVAVALPRSADDLIERVKRVADDPT